MAARCPLRCLAFVGVLAAGGMGAIAQVQIPGLPGAPKAAPRVAAAAETPEEARALVEVRLRALADLGAARKTGEETDQALARIPLTVFAFLGGALAIGVGFGTQTLLKNLISGVMLLFERKIRVGDVVEVDGVIGTVTSRDIRSTTVRQFDGIETLVPNSLLLENKVTNWTGESPLIRRTVKVGVAYGSPLRQVAELKRTIADEHRLVVKDPEPDVLFADFGESALVFTLYFWARLTGRASVASIQSDLRFMIDKRFAEAGIVIAFPQRDVSLRVAQPLPVQVFAPGALLAGGPA